MEPLRVLISPELVTWSAPTLGVSLSEEPLLAMASEQNSSVRCIVAVGASARDAIKESTKERPIEVVALFRKRGTFDEEHAFLLHLKLRAGPPKALRWNELVRWFRYERARVEVTFTSWPSGEEEQDACVRLCWMVWGASVLVQGEHRAPKPGEFLSRGVLSALSEFAIALTVILFAAKFSLGGGGVFAVFAVCCLLLLAANELKKVWFRWRVGV